VDERVLRLGSAVEQAVVLGSVRHVAQQKGRSEAGHDVVQPVLRQRGRARQDGRLLEATVRAKKNNKTLTAKLLGIDPRTVSRKLERWDDEAEADAGDHEA